MLQQVPSLMRDLSDPATVPTEVPSMAGLLVAMISELAPVSLCYVHCAARQQKKQKYACGAFDGVQVFFSLSQSLFLLPSVSK